MDNNKYILLQLYYQAMADYNKLAVQGEQNSDKGNELTQTAIAHANTLVKFYNYPCPAIRRMAEFE